MEQIIVRVRDKEKASLLCKFLRSLDFVESVKMIEEMLKAETNDDAFFALAGIWADRQVDQDSLRQRAWS